MKDKNAFLLAVIIVMGATTVSAALSESPTEKEYAEHKNYCELVSMWEEDAELGIEPTKRDGHPNYKGVNCEL